MTSQTTVAVFQNLCGRNSKKQRSLNNHHRGSIPMKISSTFHRVLCFPVFSRQNDGTSVAPWSTSEEAQRDIAKAEDDGFLADHLGQAETALACESRKLSSVQNLAWLIIKEDLY